MGEDGQQTANRRGVLGSIGATVTGASGLVAATGTAAAADPADDIIDSPYVEQGYRSMDNVDWIVMHWAGTSNAEKTMDTVTQSDNALGYHYLVNNYTDPGRVTRLGRPEQLVYHARGLNSRAIGVCYGYDYYAGSSYYYLDDECMQSLAEVVRYLTETYDIPREFHFNDAFSRPNCSASYSGGITGHTFVPYDGCQTYTHCPGIEREATDATQRERYNFDVDQFMDYVRNGTEDSVSDAFADGEAVYSPGTYNTRERPGFDDDVVAVMEEGDAGKIVNGPVKQDGVIWWGVHWTSRDVWGWTAESQLSSCPTFCHGTDVTSTVDLNVRWGPGYDYYVRHTVPDGQTGTVIGGPRRGDGEQWWQVQWDSGIDGWSVRDGDSLEVQ